MDDEVKTALKQRLLGLIRKPAQVKAKPKPTNAALWAGYIFFNLVFAFLDLITAITVGMMTNPLYGVLTFFAGFVPLFLHEFLFVRAYASKAQRIIAVIGAVLGAGSTVCIGVLAGIVNVLALATTIGNQTLEIVMIVALVVIASLHGLAVAVYFYMDEGIQRSHKRQEALAFHEDQKQSIEDAKEIVQAVKAVNAVVEEHIGRDEGELIGEAFAHVTGRQLIQPDAIEDAKLELADQLFAKKASDTSFPKADG